MPWAEVDNNLHRSYSLFTKMMRSKDILFINMDSQLMSKMLKSQVKNILVSDFCYWNFAYAKIVSPKLLLDIIKLTSNLINLHFHVRYLLV